MNMTYLYQFQFIVVGSKGVGKSSLLSSFATGDFQANMTSTVGLDFHTKTVEIDRHNFKLQLWDTAGQERFRAVVRPYYRNAVGAILVFDITDKATFVILPELMDEVQSNSVKEGSPFFILVGSKADISDERAVSVTDATHFASLHKMNYVETSAKSSHNIDEVFHTLTRRVYEAIQDGTVVVEEQWRGITRGNELPDGMHHPAATIYRRISNVDIANPKVNKNASCC